MSVHKDDGRTLPWTFLRRQIKPFSLAVSLATYVIFLATVLEAGVGGVYLDQGIGKVIAVAAAFATVLLWTGWWAQAKGLMDHGLLLASAVWSGVATVVLVEGSSWVFGLIAACWAIGSAGAWLLEVNDKRWT